MKKVLSNPTVLVAALGYFVDMFDLTLFGVVRVASLNAIGVTAPEEVFSAGMLLLNCQMIGMLVGGLAWGLLGDKRGRLSVLFGSILLYSLANIANAFVWNVESYAVLRFLAGFGLAGELGAAITLVSEVLSKEERGYGTTIVATLGLLGAVAAALTGQMIPWQWAYIIGGVMGLLLLAARFSVLESGMFEKTKSHGIPWKLFLSPNRLCKYLACILVGVPIWFITGILMTFSPELTRSLSLSEIITAGNALLYCSIGLTVGDLASGLLSQSIRSRKKAIMLFLGAAVVLAGVYSQLSGASAAAFYGLCFALGICGGYWAVFVTVAAEQFGTNMRATVATSAPNFVRASVVVINMSFVALKDHFSVMESAILLGSIIFFVAFLAISLLPETYGKDLDYIER